MLTDIMKLLFPKQTLKMYPDEVSTTLCYQRRIQHLDPMNEAYTESSAKNALPGFAIDYTQDGHVSLKKVEIKQYQRTIDGYR